MNARTLFAGGDPEQRFVIVADRTTLRPVDCQEYVDNRAAHAGADWLARTLPGDRVLWLSRRRPAFE